MSKSELEQSIASLKCEYNGVGGSTFFLLIDEQIWNIKRKEINLEWTKDEI